MRVLIGIGGTYLKGAFKMGELIGAGAAYLWRDRGYLLEGRAIKLNHHGM